MKKYTLIITEKPDAAQRVAEALDVKRKPERVSQKGVPYFIAYRGNRKLVVVPALGHMYTIVQTQGGRNYYPAFSFRWAPRYAAERGASWIYAWIAVFSKLAHDADKFIEACDYDLEGSLVGYCILKYACGNKEAVARKMRFSTLTRGELEKSYEQSLPQLDFALIEAGRIRHEVDWLYGINLSRALTLAAKHWGGRYATLSTGRVQGPTLGFLVRRERAIRCFVPTPYWSINAIVEARGSKYKAEFERKKIEKAVEADSVVERCREKTGKVGMVNVKSLRQKPPTPFNLSMLQTEAYRLFRYTPKRTTDIAERLYLRALISYPRTSSQKLPPTIDYRAILSALSEEPTYKKLASELLQKKKLEPMEGQKKDPAHPAVYPTGDLPTGGLNWSERRLWDLIVRRFMATFGEPGIKQSMNVCIKVKSYLFYLSGRQILEEGWMHFYKPYVHVEEALLPSLKDNEEIQLTRVTREDNFTKPPPRYNPSSLLNKMEREGIGTKATRADIIETLYNRRYVRKERVEATDVGINVFEVLEKHCPPLISAAFTRELEEKMEQVRSGKAKRENVLIGVVDQLRPLLKEFKQSEKMIGQKLGKAIRRARMQGRIIGNCPNCDTGQLMILHSQKTRKRFIGCTSYFEGLCTTSFPLPQRGIAKPLGRYCKSCRWPLMHIAVKGRKPWKLCFNPECPLNEKRGRHFEV